MEGNGHQSYQVVLVRKVREDNRCEDDVYAQEFVMKFPEHNYRADGEEQDQEGQYFRDLCNPSRGELNEFHWVTSGRVGGT